MPVLVTNGACTAGRIRACNWSILAATDVSELLQSTDATCSYFLTFFEILPVLCSASYGHEVLTLWLRCVLNCKATVLAGLPHDVMVVLMSFSGFHLRVLAARGFRQIKGGD